MSGERPKAVAGMVWLPRPGLPVDPWSYPESELPGWFSPTLITGVVPDASGRGCRVMGVYRDLPDVSAACLLEVIAEAWAQRGAVAKVTDVLNAIAARIVAKTGRPIP